MVAGYIKIEPSKVYETDYPSADFLIPSIHRLDISYFRLGKQKNWVLVEIADKRGLLWGRRYGNYRSSKKSYKTLTNRF